MDLANSLLITQERERQQSDLAFDAAHDDQHDAGELALAAACYAAASLGVALFSVDEQGPYEFRFVDVWPWHGNDDHRERDHEGEVRIPGYRVIDDPTERLRARKRLLQKAGALILAEMDRLDREALAQVAQLPLPAKPSRP